MLSARGQSSQREENDNKSKIVYRKRVGNLYSNTKSLSYIINYMVSISQDNIGNTLSSNVFKFKTNLKETRRYKNIHFLIVFQFWFQLCNFHNDIFIVPSNYYTNYFRLYFYLFSINKKAVWIEV